MNWFKKIFTPKNKTYKSGDNIGTVFTNVDLVNAAWTADGM